MSVAQPPTNSELKIAVSEDQVFLYFSFTNAVTQEKRNYALVITEEWNRFLTKVAMTEAAAVCAQLDKQIEEKGVLPTAEAEISELIAGGSLEAATQLLDALLQDVHGGADEFAIEGLRVHSALWQRLQEAKKAAASRN